MQARGIKLKSDSCLRLGAERAVSLPSSKGATYLKSMSVLNEPVTQFSPFRTAVSSLCGGCLGRVTAYYTWLHLYTVPNGPTYISEIHCQLRGASFLVCSF